MARVIVEDSWSKPDRATGQKVPSRRHGRGRRWRVRWRDPETGKLKALSFDRRAEADIKAREIEAQLVRGDYVDPDAGRLTVREYATGWLATKVVAPATADRLERHLRLHIYPLLGSKQLRAVRPSHIDAWIKDRADALEPSTLGVVYGTCLKPLFRTAVRDRLIPRSPCQEDVALPAARSQHAIIPTVDQVATILATVPDRYRAAGELAAGSGLRQGEIFGLEVDCVDFLRGRQLEVRQQLLVSKDHPEPYLGPPKGEASYRTIPLADSLIEALSAHLAAHPAAEVEIDDYTNPRRPYRRKARLVFTFESAVPGTPPRPMRRAEWSRIWTPARAAAGLPPGQHTGIHVLRHFYASLLIDQGASVKRVQARLGHGSAVVTLDTYGHLWEDASDQDRKAVDTVLGGVYRGGTGQGAEGRPRRSEAG